jgi:hypothetical protein
MGGQEKREKVDQMIGDLKKIALINFHSTTIARIATNFKLNNPWQIKSRGLF